MVALVWDADAVTVPEPCGAWVIPDLWRDDAAGLIALRFRCAGCGSIGSFAIGKPDQIAALTEQARLLGPHPA